MTMRKLIIAITICSLGLAAAAKEPETIDQLRTRAEAAQKGKQAELYAKLAAMQAEAANTAYNTSVDQARQLIKDCVDSAEKASQTSLASGKRQKKTEIDLRQLYKRLDDISKSWNFDDRGPVKDAMQRVEAARSKLLDRMFEK
jgi:hypothetical protein